MRKIIVALQVSVDGFIEGPNGEMDWLMTTDEEVWKEEFEMLDHIDTLILGRKIYPVTRRYWMSVLANPNDPLPENGSFASKYHIAYAAFADKTPHFVLSKTLDKVAWKNTQIIRQVDENQGTEEEAWKRYVRRRWRHAGFKSNESWIDRRASAPSQSHYFRWGQGIVQGLEATAFSEIGCGEIT